MCIPKRKFAWTVKIEKKRHYIVAKEAREVFNIILEGKGSIIWMQL